MKALLGMLVVLAFAGCTTFPYTRPETTKAEMEKDLGECFVKTSPDMVTTPMGIFMSHDVHPCMTAKGYVKQ